MLWKPVTASFESVGQICECGVPVTATDFHGCFPAVGKHRVQTITEIKILLLRQVHREINWNRRAGSEGPEIQVDGSAV